VLEARWRETYGRLLRFVEREGHARVPSTHMEEGTRLGSWVIGQRQAGRAGSLARERTQLLEALPGWVWLAR
jgi:hypothetical protein